MVLAYAISKVKVISLARLYKGQGHVKDKVITMSNLSVWLSIGNREVADLG